MDRDIEGNMLIFSDRTEAMKELTGREPESTVRIRAPDSNLSIEYKNIRSLNGRITQRFSKVGDGSIITLFDKTPYPEGDNDVVCPHFVELKWANGCDFNCSWCYLNGTFRFRPMGKKPYPKDVDKIQGHLLNYFQQVNVRSLLNSGELSDSLAFEKNGYAITENIIPLFKSQKKHKLLLLTKSANIKKLLKAEAQERVIVSFSLNAFDVARRWEKGAPGPKQRISAAKKLQDAGYTIRVRIDPIVPVENWESSYKDMIEHLFDNIEPERITIGSLRGLQSTINNSKDRSWVEYLDESSNWGKKIGFEKRAEMYLAIIDHLRREYQYKRIGLCKETVGMWKKIGLDHKKIRCNCIW